MRQALLIFGAALGRERPDNHLMQNRIAEESIAQLIEVDLARLEKQLEAAGAPWTPGRIPEWKDQ